ncbi:MAG: HNH endonuclease family protein [Ilumatobacteraceae bacterium]
MAGTEWRVSCAASRRARLGLAAVVVATTLTGCISIESNVAIDTVATTDAIAGAIDSGDATTTIADASTTVSVPTSSSGSSTSTIESDVATTPADTDPRPLALDVLAAITIENEHPDGYARDLFEHWITRNGCTTRESVLIRESLTYPQVDAVGCTVVAGDWLSVYDGAAWTDPSDLDIDHVVALKEAWDSGAWAWSAERRRAFANDLTDIRSLRAVTDNVNQSKSDADPSNWMPPLRTFWCTYLGDWVAIKARWQLSMDQSEWGRIKNLLGDECPGWRIDPFEPAPSS